MKPKEKDEARKEVTVLSKMRHPNIVQYTESFEGRFFNKLFKIVTYLAQWFSTFLSLQTSNISKKIL